MPSVRRIAEVDDIAARDRLRAEGEGVLGSASRCSRRMNNPGLSLHPKEFCGR
jgi:hypothetical protein